MDLTQPLSENMELLGKIAELAREPGFFVLSGTAGMIRGGIEQFQGRRDRSGIPLILLVGTVLFVASAGSTLPVGIALLFTGMLVSFVLGRFVAWLSFAIPEALLNLIDMIRAVRAKRRANASLIDSHPEEVP